MQDDYLSQTRPVPTRGRSGGKFIVFVLIAALVLGGAAVVWAGDRFGWFELPALREAAPAEVVQAPQPAPVARVASAPPPVAAVDPAEVAQAALGVRVAELEMRISQLNLQAEAAADNAARAEGLLIAFAARRTIERGSPLGYLEGQLKLRFGNAQPNAVDSLIEASANPVTLEMLDQGLQDLEPTLERGASATDAWSRVRQQVASLFVVRRVGTTSPAPERRLERARMFIETGRVASAIGEVERMPGAAAADEWLAMANHYVRAQRALDLIETAAILEPRTLGDANGEPVASPSPLAAPVAGDSGTF